MSDLETLKALLDRAGVAGSVSPNSIQVGIESYKTLEFYFDADGNLVSLSLLKV